jgi:hypothetical protein
VLEVVGIIQVIGRQRDTRCYDAFGVRAQQQFQVLTFCDYGLLRKERLQMAPAESRARAVRFDTVHKTV